jgi:hypothetical protein
MSIGSVLSPVRVPFTEAVHSAPTVVPGATPMISSSKPAAARAAAK